MIGSGTTARFYDPATGLAVGPELPHPGPVRGVALCADGRQAVVGLDDGRLLVWDRATGRQVGPTLQVPPPRNPPTTASERLVGVALGPDGRVVAAVDAGVVAWWPSPAAKPVVVVDDFPTSHAFSLSPDGRAFLGSPPKELADTERGTSQLWSLEAGPPPTVLPRGPVIHGTTIVVATAWRPDGGQVAIGFYGGEVRLWDVATGRSGPTLRHAGGIGDVRYTADGARLFTCAYDGTARLWDAATGEPVGPVLAHPKACYAVAVSPDGRVGAVGYQGGGLQLWELDTGRPLGGPRFYPDDVSAVAFAAGGQRVVTVAGDGLARTFDAPAPHPGTPAALLRAAERHTGLTFGKYDELVPLTPTEWAARRAD